MNDTTDRVAEEVPEPPGNTRALYAQKLELVGLIASGLVHDFNNVLTVIGSASEMLLEGLQPNDPLRRDVENIQSAIRHGGLLTKRLLALSKCQAVERTRVQLNTLVQEVVTFSRLFLTNQIKVLVHLDPAGAPVFVDRGEMEQVLLNLLLNARDALPNGGSIAISTTCLAYTAATAPRNCKLRGPVVRLRVQDNGVGMDEATMRHVFEPFFSTKPKDRGTGLGLSTVEAIVKESAGCVELASRQGLGTTVDVVLPNADRVALRVCAA